MDKDDHIFDYDSQAEEVDKLSKAGYTRGYELGFKDLHPLYSIKPGCTTYMCGHEYSGKSEIMMEIAVQMAEKHGLISAIFSPESGNKKDIFLQLKHKLLRQPPNEVKDPKRNAQAELMLQKHFYVIDPGVISISFNAMYEEVYAFERKFDILFIDPWNELMPILNGQSTQLWLEEILGRIRRIARSTGMHIFIITHPRETDRLWHSDGYLLPPSRKDYAQGQGWPRKGEAMISKWRPPYKEGEDGVNMFEGDFGPYQYNEAHIIVNKAKPKGVGMHGTAIMYYDPYTSRYYEMIGGDRYYAWEWMDENKHLYYQ